MSRRCICVYEAPVYLCGLRGRACFTARQPHAMDNATDDASAVAISVLRGAPLEPDARAPAFPVVRATGAIVDVRQLPVRAALLVLSNEQVPVPVPCFRVDDLVARVYDGDASAWARVCARLGALVDGGAPRVAHTLGDMMGAASGAHVHGEVTQHTRAVWLGRSSRRPRMRQSADNDRDGGGGGYDVRESGDSNDDGGGGGYDVRECGDSNDDGGGAYDGGGGYGGDSNDDGGGAYDGGGGYGGDSDDGGGYDARGGGYDERGVHAYGGGGYDERGVHDYDGTRTAVVPVHLLPLVLHLSDRGVSLCNPFALTAGMLEHTMLPALRAMLDAAATRAARLYARDARIGAVNADALGARSRDHVALMGMSLRRQRLNGECAWRTIEADMPSDGVTGASPMGATRAEMAYARALAARIEQHYRELCRRALHAQEAEHRRVTDALGAAYTDDVALLARQARDASAVASAHVALDQTFELRRTQMHLRHLGDWQAEARAAQPRAQRHINDAYVHYYHHPSPLYTISTTMAAAAAAAEPADASADEPP
jgi:hypothetical protein